MSANQIPVSAEPAPPRRRFLDNRIPPPVLAVAKGLAMVASASALPAAPLPLLVRIGGFALAFGVAGRFGIPAIAAFSAAHTTINPVQIDRASTLVTSGVFARSRNPMYVGLTGLVAALAFALGNAWLLAAPLLYAAYLTRYQILPEERAMAARFGADYAAYRQSVRRWL